MKRTKRNETRRQLSSRLNLLLISGALVSGCGGDSVADLNSKARTHIDKGDFQTASIELKNALQKDGNSGEARFLLGKALFKAGDMTAAEVELRKAHAAGFNATEVQPLLAQVMLSAGQFKKVIAEFGSVKLQDQAAASDLGTTVASAHAYLGELDTARKQIATVLQQSPRHARAVMLDARLNVNVTGIDAALAQVKSLVAAEPDNVEALLLLGALLLQGKQDTAGAIEAYRKAIAVKSDLVEAHSALVGLLLAQRDPQPAAAAFDAMQKRLPNHPQTRLVAAQMAVQRGDFKGAREHVQHLLRLAPENVRVLQFAGAVELELGALVQAEALLNKAVQLAPELISARAVLARIHLRAGQTDKALRVLRPDSDATLSDASMLALVAEAYLQSGAAAVAEQYFARAVKLAPKDGKIRTALALMQLSKGRSDAAFEELQAVSAAGPDTTADMALIAVRLRNNDSVGALSAIEVLERKKADGATVGALRGRAYLVGGDVANARKSFEQALTSNPTYLPAVMALSNLDLADRNIPAAQKRFEAVLKVEPKNGPVLRSLAELKIRAGAPREEVMKSLAEAIKGDPTDALSRVLQVEYLMSVKDVRTAESTAQDAVAALPSSPELIDALGGVQLQSGNTQQAVISFNKLVQLRPGSPQPYLRLGDAYLRAGDVTAAISSLRRALEITPNLLPAQRGLITLALKSKNPEMALAVVRDVKKQRPDEAVGYLLEGEYRAVMKEWDAAIAAFTAGLSKRDPVGLQLRIHKTLQAAKRNAEADRFAATWLKDHPKDGAFIKYLGDVALSKRDFAGAEQRFKELAVLDPENPAVLNNIAWLYLQQSKPGALPLAEKAVKLAPDNASLLDTLAQALVAEKQYPRAIEAGKRAIQLLPDNVGLRLSIAKVFLNAGDKALASAELDHLTQAARGSPAALAEVESLRALMQR